MKKLFLALIIVGAMTIASAADAYWLTTGNLKDSTWTQKWEVPYSLFMFDTLTFSATDFAAGDSVVDLGMKWNNFWLRSLNAAGDSGSVTVSFGQNGGVGIWHDDSVARAQLFKAVGLNTADDYLIAPIGAQYIYIRPVVGGTADSTCILEVKAYR